MLSVTKDPLLFNGAAVMLSVTKDPLLFNGAAVMLSVTKDPQFSHKKYPAVSRVFLVELAGVSA